MVTYHPWNLTGFQNTSANINPMLQFVQQTSWQMNYLPGAAILIMVFFVLFFALRYKDSTPKTAFAASSFAVTMLSILMYPIGVLNSQTFVIAIMLTPIAILILFLTE